MNGGETVNWKSMARILAAAVVFQLATLGTVLAWVDKTKLDVDDYADCTGCKDDIRIIKECLINGKCKP